MPNGPPYIAPAGGGPGIQLGTSMARAFAEEAYVFGSRWSTSGPAPVRPQRFRRRHGAV
jgi:hypothetical protein